MSAIRQVITKCQIPKILLNSSRSAAYWNKDWMPGPYPETPEQRAAAAKKYNLLPEEYEPNPDGFGDYPKLPDISSESKDPYYNWDNPEHRRDFGEPLHEIANVIGEDRWDINGPSKQLIPPYKQVLYFLGTMLGFFIPYYFCEVQEIYVAFPHMKRQLGAEGPHYKYPQ